MDRIDTLEVDLRFSQKAVRSSNEKIVSFQRKKKELENKLNFLVRTL